MVKPSIYVKPTPQPPPPVLPDDFPREMLAAAILAYSEWSENYYASGWYSLDGLSDEIVDGMAEKALADLLIDLQDPSDQRIRLALAFQRAWNKRFGQLGAE